MSTLDGQLHAPAASPHRQSPGPHLTGGWMGSRAGLDAVEKRKISYPYRESNLGRPARSLVGIPTEQ
jgi:hypothetical protein